MTYIFKMICFLIHVFYSTHKKNYCRNYLNIVTAYIIVSATGLGDCVELMVWYYQPSFNLAQGMISFHVIAILFIFLAIMVCTVNPFA